MWKCGEAKAIQNCYFRIAGELAHYVKITFTIWTNGIGDRLRTQRRRQRPEGKRDTISNIHANVVCPKNARAINSIIITALTHPDSHTLMPRSGTTHASHTYFDVESKRMIAVRNNRPEP